MVGASCIVDVFEVYDIEDTLTFNDSLELTHIMGDNTETQFINSNDSPEWTSISNLDGLKKLK